MLTYALFTRCDRRGDRSRDCSRRRSPRVNVVLTVCCKCSAPQLGRSSVIADSCYLPAIKWIKSKLTVIVYRALHGTLPRYSSSLYVADTETRASHLRSSTSSSLRVTPCYGRTPSSPGHWNSLEKIITIFRGKWKSTFVSLIVRGHCLTATV